MLTILPIVQVVSAILLTIVVLLQNREGGAGGIMGGGGVDASFYTRRGLDNFLFYATIILAAIFGLSAVLTFFV